MAEEKLITLKTISDLNNNHIVVYNKNVRLALGTKTSQLAPTVENVEQTGESEIHRFIEPMTINHIKHQYPSTAGDTSITEDAMRQSYQTPINQIDYFRIRTTTKGWNWSYIEPNIEKVFAGIQLHGMYVKETTASYNLKRDLLIQAAFGGPTEYLKATSTNSYTLDFTDLSPVIASSPGQLADALIDASAKISGYFTTDERYVTMYHDIHAKYLKSKRASSRDFVEDRVLMSGKSTMYAGLQFNYLSPALASEVEIYITPMKATYTTPEPDEFVLVISSKRQTEDSMRARVLYAYTQSSTLLSTSKALTFNIAPDPSQSFYPRIYSEAYFNATRIRKELIAPIIVPVGDLTESKFFKGETVKNFSRIIYATEALDAKYSLFGSELSTRYKYSNIKAEDMIFSPEALNCVKDFNGLKTKTLTKLASIA